jgi:asparagine synthase (glutamine-hydrolysing)
MADSISYHPKDVVESWSDARLAIARVHHEPTNRQRQPLFNTDKSRLIAMSGEVFGDENPRREDISNGRLQFPTSDAEYCLNLYAKCGSAAFAQLNGAFLIALYDTRLEELLLVTDRLGTRPVYYWCDGKKLVFGSQVRAVLRHPDVPRALDVVALFEFLAFRHVLADRTFCREVEAMPPASILRFRHSRLSLERYWQRKYVLTSHTESEHAEAVASAIKRSLQRRTRGSERYGLLLSGGLDSRSVLAADHDRKISVAFSTADFDNREVACARQIATRGGCRHVFLQRAADHYTQLVDHGVDIGDGMFQFYAAHNMGLTHHMAAHADVLFTGYGFDNWFKGHGLPYRRDYFSAEKVKLPVSSLPDDASLDDLVKAVLHMSLIGYGPQLFRIPYAKVVEAVTSSIEQKIKSCRGAAGLPAPDRLNQSFNQRSVREGAPFLYLLHLDHYHAHRLVAYDNELLDLAGSIPVRLKLNGNLMKKVLLRLSPKLAFTRNANTGLPAMTPVWPEWVWLACDARVRKYLPQPKPPPRPGVSSGSWPDWKELLRHNGLLDKLLRETIQDPLCLDPDLFNRDGIHGLYNQHLNGKDHSWILLSLVTFGRWHKKYMTNGHSEN